jgi:hypothetical protein
LRSARLAAKAVITLGPPLSALAYYTTITHEVGGNHRFSYPTYFYLVSGAAVVGTVAARRLASGFPALRAGTLVFVCLATVLGSNDNWRKLRESLTALPRDEFNQYHLRIAEALKESGIGSNATVLCDAAGIIPFVSGLNHLDRVGLTENFLSGRRPLTPEQREDYVWRRNLDVYIGFEPPASPGADGFEADPRMRTWYVRRLLGYHRTGANVIPDRTFLTTPRDWHKRMRHLRDRWHWMGEVDWEGWRRLGLKSFLYVRKDSLHFQTLVSALEGLIAVRPEEIDLECTPGSIVRPRSAGHDLIAGRQISAEAR